MNRSMCSGRVAAGPRACPPARAVPTVPPPSAQRLRVCLSLRSVGVIAELIGVLPPEGAPVLQKLVKAVMKEDMEEAQQSGRRRQQELQEAQQERQQAEQRKDEAVAVMIREKDEKMVLADKFRQQEKMLARAMYSAGVRDGRSCLEFLETLNGIVRRQRVKGWTKVLEQRPDLIDCLAKAAPSWGVDVNDSKAAEKLAGKIAGMFNVLSNRIHTFVPEVGLVVYAGVPDSPTGEALVCLAEAFGVPCERHQSVSL
ncbi:hypothetical protein HYH03_018890 [Edaphochlamys debaryana]|uniref:Uncharacterized protein n=1 Tax=Edaphochlamys debaryana TaxID=47281 RepID=A0A836BNW9_9CHLO|nr:hypothetical protein HYH03_018890 [Edaphochlamys debaryana]|eukprot:KAG2482154.1 hypothetical protein HYH03_018890 [Edaphochlamys debaryana]